LYNNGFLPQDLKGLNRISLYSQKSKCVDFFNDVISHEAISTVDKGKHIINDRYVFSTMSLVEDILVFFDKMYLKFPELYHNASPGKFGRISAVTKKDKPTYKVPFHTTDELSEYQYPYAFFYPLISGLTSLMKVDEKTQSVVWKINPTELDLSVLDLTQYVNIIKFANFDPQKIGKGDFFYVEAENIFRRLKD
jgi:Zn-finger domain-containing protein